MLRLVSILIQNQVGPDGYGRSRSKQFAVTGNDSYTNI